MGAMKTLEGAALAASDSQVGQLAASLRRGRTKGAEAAIKRAGRSLTSLLAFCFKLSSAATSVERVSKQTISRLEP